MKKFPRQRQSDLIRTPSKSEQCAESQRQRPMAQHGSPNWRRAPKQYRHSNLNCTGQQYFPETYLPGQENSFKSTSRSGVRKNGFKPLQRMRLGVDCSSRSSKSSNGRSEPRARFRQLHRFNAESSTKQCKLKPMETINKVKNSQLAELYRVISYYEGKIGLMESQLIKYEQALKVMGRGCDEKSQNKTQVENMASLLEELRHENEQLSGKIGEKDFQLRKANEKLVKSDLKISLLSLINRKTSKKSAVSALHEKDSDKVSQKSGSSLDSAGEYCGNRKKEYGNLHSKINNIEMCLNFLRKENAKLEQELEDKTDKIEELEFSLLSCRLNHNSAHMTFGKGINGFMQDSKVQDLESSVKYKTGQDSFKNDSLNQPVFDGVYKAKQSKHPIAISAQEIMSNGKATCSELNLFTLQPKQVYGSIEATDPQKLFRKLKLQLMTEEVGYESIIEKLMRPGLSASFFWEYPYNLSAPEAQQLITIATSARQQFKPKQTKALKTFLKSLFPSYSNLTLKQENNVRNQIFNSFCNRAEELDQYIEQSRGDTSLVGFQQFQKYFESWGFLNIQIDVLWELDSFSIKQIRSMVRKWQS